MDAAQTGQSILLVEDELDLGEVLAELLASEGYRVNRVTALARALEEVAGGRFDLVLTDLFAQDPGAAAGSIAPLLRAAQPTPVGVLTAWLVKAEDFRPGQPAFVLTKPVDFSELMLDVAAALAPALPADAPEARVVRAYFQALTARDWAGLGRLCAEDVVYHLPEGGRFTRTVTGRAAFERFSEETFAAYPGARFEEVAVYPTPGGAAARYLGRFPGPSGEPVSSSGSVSFALAGGRIQRIGVQVDQARLARLAPPPGS